VVKYETKKYVTKDGEMVKKRKKKLKNWMVLIFDYEHELNDFGFSPKVI